MAPNQKSPTKPSNAAEWLILNAVEHAERRKHILGSVVPKTAQYNPFDDYSPHWADEELNVEMKIGDKSVTKKKVLRDTIDKLWTAKLDYGDDEPTEQHGSTGPQSPSREDTAVQLNDILTGKIAAKKKGMQTAITSLFNLFILKHELEEVQIESGSVKRYKIDNPGGKLRDTLLPCVPWKQQLQKLFDSKPPNSPFLLVTGILICENLKVRWMRNTASELDADVKLDGNALLAALHQPPNPELAKYLDGKFVFDQNKSTKESIFATCKHDVIFAVRYHYLNFTFDRDPNAKEPNIIWKFLSRPAKAGTIKSAKMGEVVLGWGIMSYASAYVKQNKENGKAIEEEEEEEGSVDWFYSRPAPDLKNGSEDYEDDAVHQNGSADAQVDGHTRG